MLAASALCSSRVFILSLRCLSALCGAGTGTTTVPFNATAYDGVFYQNTAAGSCTRIQVVDEGKTMYRSQAQSSNMCPMQDVITPSCGAGGNFIFEKYTRTGAAADRAAAAAVSTTLLLVLAAALSAW